MTFITIGTHEQYFGRLVKCIDDLKVDGKLTEEGIIQLENGLALLIPFFACKNNRQNMFLFPAGQDVFSTRSTEEKMHALKLTRLENGIFYYFQKIAIPISKFDMERTI